MKQTSNDALFGNTMQTKFVCPNCGGNQYRETELGTATKVAGAVFSAIGIARLLGADKGNSSNSKGKKKI
jgi:hypothetical protein